MDAAGTAKVFGALGHEGRLAIFQLLVSAGAKGVPAGEVARQTGQAQSTTSANLNVLANAGLVTARRDGRSVLYALSRPRFSHAAAFLLGSSFEQIMGMASPVDRRLHDASVGGDQGLESSNDLGHDAA
ncbi:metalloregulator ArsR/SmtB family transcription factor [Phenylobacterium sp.]|uniref:ArsR/SmtB family transcription factor n=1 Tax=Phenylobacterium sp. TaxID=1871053 RepID=UPI0011FA9579|nr:metalloregulator ArsR/SmtB family transcription factor [Phenylobacterium sp.]THD66199.1 MAG: transcriptional regulator [Phenylobacterium sp.]